MTIYGLDQTLTFGSFPNRCKGWSVIRAAFIRNCWRKYQLSWSSTNKVWKRATERQKRYLVLDVELSSHQLYFTNLGTLIEKRAVQLLGWSTLIKCHKNKPVTPIQLDQETWATKNMVDALFLINEFLYFGFCCNIKSLA